MILDYTFRLDGFTKSHFIEYGAAHINSKRHFEKLHTVNLELIWTSTPTQFAEILIPVVVTVNVATHLEQVEWSALWNLFDDGMAAFKRNDLEIRPRIISILNKGFLSGFSYLATVFATVLQPSNIILRSANSFFYFDNLSYSLFLECNFDCSSTANSVDYSWVQCHTTAWR